jgi:hypothetical protein
MLIPSLLQAAPILSAAADGRGCRTFIFWLIPDSHSEIRNSQSAFPFID